MGQHNDTTFTNLIAQVYTLQTLQNLQAALIKPYRKQIDTIPTSTSNPTSHTPKLREPSAF